MALFQSTRPIRGATFFLKITPASVGISIHAPHTGRDPDQCQGQKQHRCISIHAPHTGRDNGDPGFFLQG